MFTLAIYMLIHVVQTPELIAVILHVHVHVHVFP